MYSSVTHAQTGQIAEPHTKLQFHRHFVFQPYRNLAQRGYRRREYERALIVMT